MSSIRVSATRVDLDFSTTALEAGGVEIDFGLPSAEPPLYPRAHLHVESVAAVSDDAPGARKEVAVLHTTPGDLRRFHEEGLRKLDAAERTAKL